MGLSMQDIADLIGVKRQYIHKIETGKESKALSNEQLDLISDKLGVSTRYFFQDSEVTISHDRLHFRSVSIPNYVRDRAKIYAEDFLAACLFIKQYIAPLGFEFPAFMLEEDCSAEEFITPTSMHKKEIEELANRVRGILRLGQGPISNMVRVLETNGVFICTAPEISQKVDAFCNDDILPIVVRNDYKSPARCRFDLAHELGHLIMHKGMTNDVVENPLIEKQANHFASCFLLPKATFVTEFPTFSSRRIPWDKLITLKARWKVSIAAMIMRAHDLGLIDDTTRQRTFVQISHRGWRTCEQGDHPDHPEYFEMEQPELIRNAVEIISNTHDDFLPKLKHEMCLENSLIRKIIGMPDLPDNAFSLNEPHLRLVK